VFGYFGNPETGKPTDEHIQMNWIWDLSKIRKLAEQSSDETVFICGGAINQDEIRGLFAKRFTLVIDDETMRHRLLTRTSHDFGKKTRGFSPSTRVEQGNSCICRRV
jgi:hypothetical protein